MDRESIIQKFESLRVWKRGNERAPHKPLLLLYAIGKLMHGEKFLSYADIEEELHNLLKEFGPWRKTSPRHPFWRLRKDGLWEIPTADRIREDARGNAYLTELRDVGVGNFPEPIANQLQNDFGLVFEVIGRILTAHFPITYHQDILQAVGIDLSFEFSNHRRDANFRKNILEAYGNRCAICGFNVTLRGRPIALEASHIKWHAVGGPDTIENGIAFCSLHHKLFDRGVFTLSTQLEVLISEYASGTVGFEEWLMRFHGRKINFPKRQEYYPCNIFIDWHLKEVFKADYRFLKKN